MTSPRVWVLSGNPGTGKTTVCFESGKENPENITEYWDIENKNLSLKNDFFADRMIEYKPLLALDNRFMEDWYNTYLNIQKEIDRVIDLGQKVLAKKIPNIGFNWLCIDGVTPIRKKCMLAKWMYDHSEKCTGKPSRKNPTEFEYKEINANTQKLLFPLVNMTVAGIIPGLIFTAEFEDDRKGTDIFDEVQNKLVTKSIVIGRKPAYKDDIGYKGVTLLELHADTKTKKYKLVCSKAPGVGMFDADVTGKSVYDVIVEKGL